MCMLQQWNCRKGCANSPSGSGFTLIEIAVVLVILGLIIGTLAPMMVSMIKKDKLKEGHETVKKARNEIIGYIMINKKLPTSISSIGHSRDPWQNDLFFIAAPNLINKDICSWINSGNTQTGLALCTGGSCSASNKKSNVVFIIGSKAENYNRQTDNGLVNRDADPADNEVMTYDYSQQVDNYSDSTDPARNTDNFDDLLQFATLSELSSILNCASSPASTAVTLYNGSSQTICLGSSSISPGQTIASLSSGQTITITSPVSGLCAGSSASQCNISYGGANSADSDGDHLANFSAFSNPNCQLTDK